MTEEIKATSNGEEFTIFIPKECDLKNANLVKEKGKEERKMSKWITIAEELPRTGEEVLITYIYCDDDYKGEKIPTVAIAYYNTEEYRWESADPTDDDVMIRYDQVIAWMPLPKAYIWGEKNDD